ncbi:MAG: hypothetical protein ABI696_14445, partial [Rubrivivax sp.]
SLGLPLAGCGGGDSDPFPGPFRLTLRAEDPFGFPVPQVGLELRDDDVSIVLRSGVTGADGELQITFTEAALLPGDFSLTIVPPPGYALAPGQPSVVRISIRSREGLTVVVVLIRL